MKIDLKPLNLLILLLLIGYSSIFGQDNYAQADSIARTFHEPYNSAQELAQKLTKNLSSDRDKAHVFYMWIANNIVYDCRKFQSFKGVQFQASSEAELRDKMANWKKNNVQKTLTTKRGICMDYSHLFEAMCEEVGLEVAVISGDARSISNPSKSSNNLPHAWNAVYVDGEWQLLDVTWAAGYTNQNVSVFTRKFSPGYFFTRPEWFVQTHFPEDPDWQLLDEPISKAEFMEQPILNCGGADYIVHDYGQETLEGKVYNKSVWFNFEEVPKVFRVTTRKKKLINYQKKVVGNKVILTYDGSYKEIHIFGGKSMKKKFGWLAIL